MCIVVVGSGIPGSGIPGSSNELEVAKNFGAI